MRLIDADARIKQLEDEIKALRTDIEVYKGSNDSCFKYMVNRSKALIAQKSLIISDYKMQQTAYNVESVVEELEKLTNHYHKCCLSDYNEGAEVGVRESMAIVRKGGV